MTLDNFTTESPFGDILLVADGQQGPAGTIQVGNITRNTGNITVTNRGTANNAILDFNFPPDVIDDNLIDAKVYGRWFSGSTIGDTIRTSFDVSNTESIILEVSEGNLFNITCYGASNGRAYYFLDD